MGNDVVQTGWEHDFSEKMKLTEVTAPKARDEQHPTESYYSLGYPQEVRQTKFITAIILKDSINDKNLPIIERLHNETMNGVKITQDGKTTELYLNLLADVKPSYNQKMLGISIESKKISE